MQVPPWAFLPWQFQIRFALNPSCMRKPCCPSPALLLGSESQRLMLLAPISHLKWVSCHTTATYSGCFAEDTQGASSSAGTYGWLGRAGGTKKLQPPDPADTGMEEPTLTSKGCFYTVTFSSPKVENPIPRAFQMLDKSCPHTQHSSCPARGVRET